MVLLAAAICTKTGKAVVSRQFMEISRSRIEGLLAAFPKLKTSDEQHTFVETDSVRYVYQPMDSLYMVLITTKNSNILEDLETLRLFARVVPEYCSKMDEESVTDQAFDLIFAFDEIVALGYRENVSLSQIRTYTEMESLTENMFRMEQKHKEREQKERMKAKAKELAMLKKHEKKSGFSGMSSMGNMSGIGSSSQSFAPAPTQTSAYTNPAPARTSSTSKKPAKGMKLGGKPKTNDFVAQLEKEGQHVGDVSAPSAPSSSVSQSVQPEIVAEDMEDVHVQIEETVSLTANRDGGMEAMEVKGEMTITINNEDFSQVKFCTERTNSRNIPFTTHPQINKKVFQKSLVLEPKNRDRPFPIGTKLGVLRWRFQGSDDDDIPLLINCWPTITKDGAEVNVDYELNAADLELRDVIITIPLPSGAGNPVVVSADGDYNHDSRHNVLSWRIPVINEDNSEGSFEFTMLGGDSDDFFPVMVDFTSETPYGGIAVSRCELLEDGNEAPMSKLCHFGVDKYEFV